MLPCAAVCCSGLNLSLSDFLVQVLCVASRCSVLLRVAIVYVSFSRTFSCSCCVSQRVAACCSVLQRVAACCSVLQCVAVCCIVLQCIVVWCSAVHFGAVYRSMVQCYIYIYACTLMQSNTYTYMYIFIKKCLHFKCNTL